MSWECDLQNIKDVKHISYSSITQTMRYIIRKTVNI